MVARQLFKAYMKCADAHNNQLQVNPPIPHAPQPGWLHSCTRIVVMAALLPATGRRLRGGGLGVPRVHEIQSKTGAVSRSRSTGCPTGCVLWTCPRLPSSGHGSWDDACEIERVPLLAALIDGQLLAAGSGGGGRWDGGCRDRGAASGYCAC